MPREESLVHNLADEEQVKKGKEKFKSQRDQELDDLRFILNTQQGQRFMRRLLEQCHTFGSIWSPSAAIHYNAGQQDIGHFLMGEITKAGPQLLVPIITQSYQGEANGRGNQGRDSGTHRNPAGNEGRGK